LQTREVRGLLNIGLASILVIASHCLAQQAPPVVELTVAAGTQPNTRISNDQVDEILKSTTTLWKSCGIGFRRNGTVASTVPDRLSVLMESAQMDELDANQANVKIVAQIGICKEPDPNNPRSYVIVPGLYDGCTWNGRRSIIVIRKATLDLDAAVWAHEIGHTFGLPHRETANSLMARYLELVGPNLSLDECRIANQAARAPAR